MFVETLVRDIVTDEYADECNLTGNEVDAIVNEAKYDKQLQFEIEQSVVRYIEEFLWDIGKPTKAQKEFIDACVDDYDNWQKSAKAWAFITKEYEDIPLEKQRFLCSVLRGRRQGGRKADLLDRKY